MTKKAIKRNEIANKGGTKPKRGNPAWQKGGASPNPSGRPANEISITHWLKEVAGMTPAEAVEKFRNYADQFSEYKGDLPIAAFAAIRVWAAILAEPSPGIFGQLLDRIDGPVPSVLQGDKNKPLEVNVNDARERLAHLVNQFVARTGTKPDSGESSAG